MTAIRYETIGRKDIVLIEPLWEKLRRHHQDKSKHFKKRYRLFSFEERMQDLFGKVRGDLVRILVAREPEKNGIVGYCIASVDYLGGGEIDSLFVEAKFRKAGVGKELVRQSLTWLKKQKVPGGKTKIVVAVGNEEALGFYRKLGFIESKYILEEKMGGQ